MKNILVLFITLILVIASNINLSLAQESYKKGDTILIPASIGTDESILGQFYDLRFNMVIIDSTIDYKISTIRENTYQSEFHVLENESILSLGIEAFGLINLSSNQSYQQKNALLSAYQVREIKKIELPLNSDAPLFVSSLYYGWSLNYLLSGNSQAFSDEVALDIRNSIQYPMAGFSLENKLSESDIKHRLIIRGLEQTSSSIGVSINPSDVNKNFTEGESVPIFVEFTFLEDHNPFQMNWSEIKQKNSEIGIGEIYFQISEQKDNYSKWDNSSTADPILEVYFDTELVMTTDPIVDMITPTIPIDASIEFSELDKLTFVLYDHDDFTSNDIIGRAAIPIDVITKDFLSNELELVFDGNIVQAIISFFPLDAEE